LTVKNQNSGNGKLKSLVEVQNQKGTGNLILEKADGKACFESQNK
jgi:hypothetical protein